MLDGNGKHVILLLLPLSDPIKFRRTLFKPFVAQDVNDEQFHAYNDGIYSVQFTTMSICTIEDFNDIDEIITFSSSQLKNNEIFIVWRST